MAKKTKIAMPEPEDNDDEKIIDPKLNQNQI